MKRGTWSFSFTVALAVFLFASLALAHGGGLDAKGCHTERRTGEYHCHRPQEAEKPGNSSAVSAYDRKEWHPRWRDADGDCQNTRHEVLAEESLVPVTLSPDGCKVVAGQWFDPYSGETFISPRNLDIDHLVPLKEAHISSGNTWSTEKKRGYANDLSSPATLIAVSKSENRLKGAKDPAKWLPPNHAYRCEYVRLWKEVKARWGLGSDAAENKSIEDVERGCR
ncbi:MAG: YHYH domain-containing protein [Candidatus Dadabacteria bacterium]|nr:YHYH domain-containing protein [Candidatus Dadabacteria bacterium]